MYRTSKLLVAGLMWLILLCSACSKNPVQVEFIIIRAENLDSHNMPIAASGLDRNFVDRAICEILDSQGNKITSQSVQLDENPPMGGQELVLKNIPQGSGYYARILGLEKLTEYVYECGVTGPFTLIAGRKHTITLVIDRPSALDPYCNLICGFHHDCVVGSYCRSPCSCDLELANSEPEKFCYLAQCHPARVGTPCDHNNSCAISMTCYDETMHGFPCGYCSNYCTADSDCPAEAICCPAQTAGTTTNICVSECGTDLPLCREDYECRPITSDNPPLFGCLPL